MSGLCLITSGAYVDQELSAEFGQIPPAFLPIGVSRLYEAQVALLGTSDPIYLTLPESFIPQPYDENRLRTLNVILVPVPEGLSLGESVVYVLNYIEAGPNAVRILHGDTLIEDLPTGSDDLVAIHHDGDDYSWAAVNLQGNEIKNLQVIHAGTGHDGSRPVACGYFAFGSASLLVRSITRARGSFIGGINLYAEERRIEAARVSRWRDFGHIQTYFRSRRAITTARSFNSLRVEACAVSKSSDDKHKMQAEAAWFSALPPAAQPYAARLLQAGERSGAAFYDIEYQFAPTLAELYVFSSIGRPTWQNIFKSCQEFLDICARHKGPGSGDAILAELAIDKTVARLEQYAAESGFDIRKPTQLDDRPLPSLLHIAQDLGGAIDFHSGRPASVMHGDFCFSNIFYNSRAGRIIVIDPRGHLRPGEPSIFGDLRYDLAKLSHSVVGNYDHILADRYTVRRDASHRFAIDFDTNPQHAWLRSLLDELSVDGISAASLSVRAVMVGLFLSMLPLHGDRPVRQTAFIANALRLYAELEVAPS